MGDATKIKAAAKNDMASLEKLTVPWHHLVCPTAPDPGSKGFLSINFLNGPVSGTGSLPPYVQKTGAVPRSVDGIEAELALEFGIMGRIDIDLRK